MSKLLTSLSNLFVLFPILTTIRRHLFTQMLVLTEFQWSFCKFRESKKCGIAADTSRALTSAEKNYSQLERRYLAGVYGFEKNHLYLLGRTFTIYSDHKPFVSILNKPRTIESSYIERLMLCLQGYHFKITHISSDENISDYSGRHPFVHLQENCQYLKESIKFVFKNACPKALTIDDIKESTKNDKTPQKLKYFALETDVPKLKNNSLINKRK